MQFRGICPLYSELWFGTLLANLYEDLWAASKLFCRVSSCTFFPSTSTPSQFGSIFETSIFSVHPWRPSANCQTHSISDISPKSKERGCGSALPLQIQSFSRAIIDCWVLSTRLILDCVLTRCEGNEIFDDRFEYFYAVDEMVQYDSRVVHRIQRPQKRTVICTFIVASIETQSFASQIEAFDFHGSRDADLYLDIFFAKGLLRWWTTSNMKSLALTICFDGSLALYLGRRPRTWGAWVVPGGDEGAEVGSGGEDESVYVIFLVVFDLLVPAEEGTGAFYLLDGDDVGLAEQASAFGEPG